MPTGDSLDAATAGARTILSRGAVIPAHPLALTPARKLDEQHQRALTRYYLDAGVGGLAVGVHITQFEIREHGLYAPLLELTAHEARSWSTRPVALIAGVTGRTTQAVQEARTARALGYTAAMVNVAAFKNAPESEALEHCRAVAAEMPIVGFALAPEVGGTHMSYDFWRRFAAIDNVLAIKIATFDRYRTLDVIRGVVDAAAQDRITMYTGNDDHIVADLLTPLVVRRGDQETAVRIRGGLLGPGEPSNYTNGSQSSMIRRTGPWTCCASTRASPIATQPSTTRTTTSPAASRAAWRCSAGRGWSTESGALTPRS